MPEDFDVVVTVDEETGVETSAIVPKKKPKKLSKKETLKSSE